MAATVTNEGSPARSGATDLLSAGLFSELSQLGVRVLQLPAQRFHQLRVGRAGGASSSLAQLTVRLQTLLSPTGPRRRVTEHAHRTASRPRHRVE